MALREVLRSQRDQQEVVRSKMKHQEVGGSYMEPNKKREQETRS